MFHSYAVITRILLCSFVCFAISSLTFAQAAKNLPPNNVLTTIERDIELGRLAEAEGRLLEYAVQHPQDARPLELLAALRLRQNRLSEAEALCKRALTVNPNREQAKIYLAQIQFRSGRQQESRNLLVEVAKSPPADPVTRLNLAEALTATGEFEKSLTIISSLPPTFKKTMALPLIAANQLGLGRRQEVLALIPAMERSATNPVIAVGCAEVLQGAGMNAEAIALLQRALRFSPGNAHILVSIARLEIQKRKFAEARRNLNRAAMLAPLSVEVQLVLSTLESEEGNSAEAIAALQKAREIAPDSATILTQLAVVSMRANQPSIAFEAARELMTLKPEDSEALYLFGAAALQNGNLISAREALERFVKLHPKDPRGCVALGITIVAQKDDLKVARSQFEHCLQISPTNVEAGYQLGLLFKSEGDTPSAIRLLEEVTTREPRHSAALRDLGSLYLQSNEAMKARAVLERAVALNSQDAEAHFLLSRVYSRIGEAALASRHLELFQKLKKPREKPTAP